jgi:tetratricopeptide (TPR) repeat protein
MQVIPNKMPDPAAFRGFVEGVQNLQDYLQTNESVRLGEAEEQFNESLTADPNFEPAQYYKAITLTHARRAEEAAEILEDLNHEEVPFRTEVLCNLAFAYGKIYNYEKVKLALETIIEAEKQATTQQRDDLRLLAAALKAWVNAVFGAYGFGHPDDFQSRQKHHLPEAVKVAQSVINDPALDSLVEETRLAVKVEALGAAGGALMYMGLYSARFNKSTDEYWAEAESYYKDALKLHPRNVRVLDDLATLHLMRACRFRARHQLKDAENFALEAVKTENKALSYHSHDQFRYFQRAHALALLGEWDKAATDADQIPKEPGALSGKMVDELKLHIKHRELDPILKRYQTEEKSMP